MGLVESFVNAPNFEGEDADKAYFKRDVTFGYTEYTTKPDVEPPFRPEMKLPYMVMPCWYYQEGEIYLQINLHPLYDVSEEEIVFLSDEQIQTRINIWKNKMNVTAPKSDAIIPFGKVKDPFVAETFDNINLDMEARVKMFKNEDLGAFSGSDETGEIFLLTSIVDHEFFR